MIGSIFWLYQFTQLSSTAASWPFEPCPTWSWWWLALLTKCLCQQSPCKPWVPMKRRHGTTSCTASVASHVFSKWVLGTSSTLVSHVHARCALKPIQLQTYEELTSPTNRWTLSSKKRQHMPMWKKEPPACGACPTTKRPGTAHMFKEPTSSIALCRDLM